MSQFAVVDHARGNESEPMSKAKAQEKMNDLEGLVDDPDDIEMVPVGTADDADEADPTEVVDGGEPVPEGRPDIDEDPVDFMPEHFIDEIQGVPTLNRKGYAVMAERFNVSVTAEPVERASENDFEYAEFRAIARTEDGTEYSGFGSAHVDRKDGDDKHLLNELAETRAMKRAASWAMGLGMTAREEMEGTL